MAFYAKYKISIFVKMHKTIAVSVESKSEVPAAKNDRETASIMPLSSPGTTPASDRYFP